MGAPAFSAFDPTSAAFRENPYPVYKYFRDIDPVFYRRERDDWIVTGYEAVREWLSGPRPSKPSEPINADGAGDALRTGGNEGPEYLRVKLRTSTDYHFNHSLQQTSPPYHTHLKKIVGEFFSKEFFNIIKVNLSEIAESILNNKEYGRTFDVNDDFAFPFTATVICHILGLPISDRTKLREWSYNYQLAASLLHTRKDILRRNMSLMGMASYVRAKIHERAQRPSDDFIGFLTRQHSAGRISYDAVVGNIMTIILGGFENTQNGICLAAFNLLRSDGAWGRLRDDTALLPSAVEECLRFDPPVQCFYTDQYEGRLGGHEIRAGQQVHILFGAANRDPEIFAQPDVFEIATKKSPHLSFGSGIHYCLGAYLARIEMELALEALLRRFPRLTLCEKGLCLNPIYGTRSVEHLYVAS